MLASGACRNMEFSLADMEFSQHNPSSLVLSHTHIFAVLHLEVPGCCWLVSACCCWRLAWRCRARRGNWRRDCVGGGWGGWRSQVICTEKPQVPEVPCIFPPFLARPPGSCSPFGGKATSSLWPTAPLRLQAERAVAVAVATAALAALRAARCPKREATHAAVVKTVLGQNISPGEQKSGRDSWPWFKTNGGFHFGLVGELTHRPF